MTIRPRAGISSGSPTSLFVPPTCFGKRTTRRRWLLTALFLAMLLCANVLSNWNTPPVLAAAVAKPHPVPAHLTYAQYLTNGRPDHATHGSPVLPYKPVIVPGLKTHGPTNTKRAPSAELASMQPLTLTLSSTFLAGGANVQPLDAVGSDHRLEMRVQPGSLDLSRATVGNKPFVPGPVTLQLTQNFGHFAEGINLLGEYSLSAVDRHGHAITGIRLRAPITFIYHYQTWEMTNLGLDPGHLFLLWPDLLYAARKAHGSIAGLMLPMQDNAQAHTLTAQTLVFGNGRFDVGGGDPSNQSPAPSPLASSSGNSGQMSYSYPLHLAPGSGGFGPTLTLSYSSNGPNEQYSQTSPASSVGQGWSLGLGAITMETYPAGSASQGTWYFLSGVDNISDRLVPSGSDSTGTYFDTEHISRLHIELLNGNECLHTNQPCFKVWDTSGTTYQFGDTTDSLQYYTDSTGTRHNYEWDLRLVMAPHATAATQYDQYMASYEQDMNTDGNGHTSVRASALKQITYGLWNTQTNSQVVAGTVDFAYRAPFNDGRWATTYGTNYNCSGSPPTTTTLRCDDPLTMVHDGVTVNPPTVMQTFSLQLVTTYVGDDSIGQHSLASYSFTYQDIPFHDQCWDSYTQYYEYCVGEHLLTSITPAIFQQGTQHAQKPIKFGYTQLTNNYIDSQHKNLNGGQYSVQTYWHYLTSYLDTNTGAGGTVAYATAHANAHGTPTIVDGQGHPTDDRTDPLYCNTHGADCTTNYSGHYANPDDETWSVQVVTQLATWGTDSSSSRLAPAATSYHYRLAISKYGYNGKAPYFCYPDQYNQDQDCVSDIYVPVANNVPDGDWQDYFHAEFRGFNLVYITTPAGDLTEEQYFSTEGLGSAAGDGPNYNGGQMYQQDIYQVTSTATTLLQETTIGYTGINSSTACDGSLNLTYVPCLSQVTSRRTTDVEGGDITSAPWVETDYTYDDYFPNNQYGLGAGYNNLTAETITSSNGPPMQKTWTYSINDTTPGNPSGYYTVNKATHSELDALDSSGHVKHVWQCVDTTYDEGIAPGTPTPVNGWATTVKTYSDCTNPASAIPHYQGYDVAGNAVATVDGLGAANSSLYGSNGCTLPATPAFFSSAWSAGRYTVCTTYDSFNAQPATITNALSQNSSITYDQQQSDLPTEQSDANGQETDETYSYDGDGNRTTGVKQPGEGTSYTTQSGVQSTCSQTFPPALPALPCFENESNTQFYQNAVTRTYYDAQGRAVETRTPGPDSTHDTIVFTVYNDQLHTSFTSVPFEVSPGTTWVDPASVSSTPGTATFYDALGRGVATQDPAFNPPSVPGIPCQSLQGSAATTCVFYGWGNAQGDGATYSYSATLDANNHLSVSFQNALGWTLYTQHYNGTYSGGTGLSGAGKLVQQLATQYNVLGEPLTVTTTDEAAQPTTSVAVMNAMMTWAVPSASATPKRAVTPTAMTPMGRCCPSCRAVAPSAPTMTCWAASAAYRTMCRPSTRREPVPVAPTLTCRTLMIPTNWVFRGRPTFPPDGSRKPSPPPIIPIPAIRP